MTFEQGVVHLTKTFQKMLNKAEQMFGERDKNWTFIGIEFREDGPYINYYGSQISIVLSSNCSQLIPNFPQLYFQLSHEVCHLLYPTGKADANVLNEGISTYFSKVYLDSLFPGNNYALKCIQKSNYHRAYQLVERLIESDSEAIKKIRALNPKISYVTEDEIKSLNFNLTDKEILELVQRF